MGYDTDGAVSAIERKYDVRAIESEVSGLWYLEIDKKRIGILTINGKEKTCVVLTKGQARTLVSEIKDIYELIFE